MVSKGLATLEVRFLQFLSFTFFFCPNTFNTVASAFICFKAF